MDLLKGNIKTIYFKYLTFAFGSAFVSSIYSIVDMAMIGQYQGPQGTAALAVVAPIWNIIYSLGLWMGIGGSVIYSTLKGKMDAATEKPNEYFSVAVIGSCVMAVIVWIIVWFFDAQLLMIFGANGELLPLAKNYMVPIKFVLPSFLLTQMLAAFLRNDNDPTRATVAVLAGGVFNVFGDYFFIFVMDLGLFGAGLATAMGSVISCLVMLSHFVSKKNRLRFVFPNQLFTSLKKICVTGFSSFFIDVAMGILTILFNRQIMRYLGTDALSIYGILVNISTFVQCCAYSVGQAAQPILSVNYGAKKADRIYRTLRYALYSVLFFSLFWTIAIFAAPNFFVRLFMAPTENILHIAPSILRCYGSSFLLLPLNIFSTYYFQALLKPKAEFVVSVARGLIVSGILIYILPLIQKNFLWWTMPLTEAIVAVYSVFCMKQYTQDLKEPNRISSTTQPKFS